MRDVTPNKANKGGGLIVENTGHLIVRATHILSKKSHETYNIIGPNITKTTTEFSGFDIPVSAASAPPGKRIYETNFNCPACGNIIPLRIEQRTMLYLPPEIIKQDKKTDLIRKINFRRLLNSLVMTIFLGTAPAVFAYFIALLVIDGPAEEDVPARLTALIIYGAVFLYYILNAFHPSRGVLLVIKRPTALGADHPSTFNYIERVTINCGYGDDHYLGDPSFPNKSLYYSRMNVDQGLEIPTNAYTFYL